MARKSACEKLLDLVDTNPRFLLAGPAASMIFIRLVRLMAQLGDASALRLGFVFGSWKEVAFGLRISETELETHLETLAARGVIERDEASLTLPDWLGVRDRRAETARENGKKGGRPRKNTADPRQANILYPLAGGAPPADRSETQETKIETQSEALSRGRFSSSSEKNLEEEKEGGLSVLLQGLVKAGALHPNHESEVGEAEAWLTLGFTVPDIRNGIATALRRGAKPRNAPLRYFTKIVEAMAEQRRGAPGSVSLAAAEPLPQAADEDPAITALKAESDAMWARFRDAEGGNGRCPPSRSRWLAGDVEDADLWRAYITEGRSAFQRAA